MPGADASVPILNAKPEPDICPDSNIKDEIKKVKPLENGFNGHSDLKEVTQNGRVVTSDVGTLLRFDIFSSCKQLSAKTSQQQNGLLVEETKEATSKFRSIASDIEICANQIRAFMKTRNIIFMSPLSSLKTHPQFKTLYNSVLIEDQRKTASAASDQTEVKETRTTADGLEVLNVIKTKTNLPPAGEFKRKELTPGMKVYVMKTSQVGEFGVGTILSVRDSEQDKLYKVRFDSTKTAPLKLFTAKQLAYMESPDVIVPVGTRICARYCDGVRSAVYAGITAEPPKITNNERYLIFFDDGYAQYIYHHDIFAMCGQSNDVADDVHENLKDFIKGYLQKFPERPMVKLQKNQITKTEYECKWWDTKVLDIDASMVKMYFIESHRTEWIYRGSTRLKLLFNELQNAEEHRRAGGKNRRHNIVPRKPHQPYVEYTREEEVVTLDSDEENEVETIAKYSHPRRKTGGGQYLSNNSEVPVRNKARKSGSGAVVPKSRFAICNVPLKCRSPDIKSHLGYREIRSRYSFTRVTFQKHSKCSILCKEKDNPSQLKGQNPMLIPIHLGWERQVRKYKKKRSPSTKFKVIYRTPCGRHLRSLEEIQLYLYITSSNIPIDFFSTDPALLVFRTFRAKEVLYDTKDITLGKENVPVACVNSWSDVPPPFVEYESQRFPGKNVYLNLDPDFLCGCSCTDNCQDPEKCECQQITSYARYGAAGGESVGYKFRRLKEPIVTGIYECNVKCKCGPSCGNRVVQNGLQVRLQMFKTERKGWGIRCLDDLDAGQFICIYAGQLLTDQGADEDGNEFGDEYLAELDHIEVAEKIKEGYESDVQDIEEDYEEDKNDNKSEFSDDDPNDPDASFSDENDSDFEPNLRSTAITSLSTRRSKKAKFDSDSQSSQSVNEECDSEYSNGKRKNKWLPDISSSLDMITITPRPLSPESEAFVDKIELIRTPKLSDNAKTVAKKSINSKQTVQLKPPRKENKFRTIRSYYGDESCYIMDAKSKGNIGRYLNHSCAPNVFVQNVFTDSHDLRFPAIAFFAMHYILAGTELTWDYNYEVGSVVDKVMYCYCDARNCRGRLL